MVVKIHRVRNRSTKPRRLATVAIPNSSKNYNNRISVLLDIYWQKKFLGGQFPLSPLEFPDLALLGFQPFLQALAQGLGLGSGCQHLRQQFQLLLLPAAGGSGNTVVHAQSVR